MRGLLEGKPVVVIGADTVGAGIARRIGREGARLAVLDEDVDRARRVASALSNDGANPFDHGATAFALSADYSSIELAVSAAADQLGGVYALINNFLPPPRLKPFEEQTTAVFAEAFGRVRAATGAMQTAMPFMRAAGEGRIVNVGHRYGQSVNEGLAAYNAAAWSLVGITRSAALDWGRYQIATNLLLPLADTQELADAKAKRANIMNLMLSQVPLQRAGDCVEDIGGAALFLLSDAANFVNGEIIHADGGQHIAGPVLNPIRFS